MDLVKVSTNGVTKHLTFKAIDTVKGGFKWLQSAGITSGSNIGTGKTRLVTDRKVFKKDTIIYSNNNNIQIDVVYYDGDTIKSFSGFMNTSISVKRDLMA